MKIANPQIEPDDTASDFIVPLISMDRLQATCAILNYLLRNCCCIPRYKNNPISLEELLDMAHFHFSCDIKYINMNANNFQKYMKFFGAIWWYEQFLMNYADEDPNIAELYSSFVLSSDTQKDYIVVTYETIYNDPINERELDVIMDMENNYGFLSSLVDGYMWAQICENQVSKIYQSYDDIDESDKHGFDYIVDKARIEFGLTEQDLLLYQIP